ncbi:hypothetical protein [Cardinium endosymbiont of Oedothorax gibbosus]|uniref:hypothetical protein n=1 Tax=Cardinium endosymbiont of Oedothorax gibbosus TaxID=931101 RepID=UPI002024B6F2|nr:hypothetical protein [Cardinium endosymbiont of Oedothorax gibbosus]CAH2559710.1 Sodium:glucose symporter superfamily protein [Cardinium endosymbiont of Oedothorax gibbosus]
MHLDSLIFVPFLLINLLVSICAIKYAGIQATRFTTAHIIAAILVITYGGEVLCHSLHIDSLLSLTGSAMSYFIIGILLVYRLHLFLNNCSVAEIMGRLYGNSIRKIVAICGILHSVSVVAMQFKLLAIAMCSCFTIQAHYSLLIAALLIMSSMGSNNLQLLPLIRVIRCTIFGILLSIIAWILWKCMVNQYNADQASLALAMKRSWSSLMHTHAAPLDYMVYLTAFAIPAFYPAQVASILMAKNATQIKCSFNGAGFFSLSINLLLLWIALLTQKNSSRLMLSAIPLSTFDAYLGLKGLFMIGFAALISSTAGANLHAATGLMTNDLPDLFKWIKKPIIYRFMVGVMATLLELYPKDQMLWMTIILFKTFVSLPLLLSLIGISLHPYTVLIGMLTGGITTMAWCCFVPNVGMNGLLPAIVMNLLSMMVVQFFKGKQSADQPYLTNSLAQAPVPKRLSLWKRLAQHVWIKKFNLWDYLQKQLPKDNLPYILFSFYILLTGYGSFYTFSSNPIWYARLEAFILLPSLFVATFFLVYVFIAPQPYVRKIVSVIWPLSYVYFLFLVGTGIAMLSKFAHLHDIILILNLCLSIFLTPLIVLLFECIMSGIVVWIVLHYIDGNSILIDCFLDLNLNIVYAIFMLFVLVGGFLYHNKGLNKRSSMIQALTSEQKEQNAKQFFNKQQVEALAYESSYIISQLNNQLIRRLEPSEVGLALINY